MLRMALITTAVAVAITGLVMADSRRGAGGREYLHFYCLGIDGLFSDNPDSAVTAKALFANSPREVCKPWQ